MSDYVIVTRGLTKHTGEQNSVFNLSIHEERAYYGFRWGRNGAGKPPPCGCCWALQLHLPVT